MRRAFVIAAMVVSLVLTGCNLTPVLTPEQNENAQVEQAEEATTTEAATQKKKVVVLATGGTIAGVGEKGKSTGYESGTLSAETLIEAVPELKDVADIEAIQVCNVNSDDCKGKGVLVVFSDRIFSARSVIKTSTYPVTAISAGEMGAIGIVRDGKTFLYETPSKRHTTASEFDIDGVSSLPKVSILYFSVDADPELLEYAAKSSKGIVIAGAGEGEFSEAYKQVVDKLTIPVVISSRIDDGNIVPENLLCEDTIAADNLSPQKASVLLRLALAKGMDKDQIRTAFTEY